MRITQLFVLMAANWLGLATVELRDDFPEHRRQPKQRASQYSTMPSARMRR